MNKTIKKASGAIKTDSKDISVEVPVSTVAITGFATPAVVVVDVSRNAEVFPFIAAAVPPPAIIAKVQLIAGLISPNVAIITAVPATAANGIAIVSNKLSNQGM